MAFIIDGAPGSGKTTLLFGNFDNLENKNDIPCLKDYGFEIVPESITEIANEIRREGRVPTENLEEFIERTINKSIEDSSRFYNGNCFLERGLPGYFFIEDIFKTKLPDSYFNFCKIIEYDSPIFILEPIYSFDMSSANKNLRKGRVATLEQRKNIFEKTKELYKELGYKIEVIPCYSDDIFENNSRRIEHILKYINI